MRGKKLHFKRECNANISMKWLEKCSDIPREDQQFSWYLILRLFAFFILICVGKSEHFKWTIWFSWSSSEFAALQFYFQPIRSVVFLFRTNFCTPWVGSKFSNDNHVKNYVLRGMSTQISYGVIIVKCDIFYDGKFKRCYAICILYWKFSTKNFWNAVWSDHQNCQNGSFSPTDCICLCALICVLLSG